jgi:hypothetical protein
MVDIRDNTQSHAPPVLPAATCETEARSNMHKQSRKASARNTQSPASFTSLYHQPTVNESRDEQASKSLGRNESNQETPNFEDVLHQLNKNISSARANHKPKKRNTKVKPPASKAFTLNSALEEFLRVHNCEPLLESDDDCTFVDSVASGLTREVTEELQPKTHDDNEHDFDEDINEEHDNDDQELRIKDLQRQLNESLQAISALESQLTTHIPPSPIQIAQLVNDKRTMEEMTVGKRMLEAQLASTQKQLFDAKQDALNANTKMNGLEEENKRLNEELNDAIFKKEAMELKLTKVKAAEKNQHDSFRAPRTDAPDTDDATLQQLRVDLNEARSHIHRLEKERNRERRHYQRLMEGATSNRADLDERIDKEMENNMEMRRRCYVFEQKLNVKKQQVVELEADLSAVTEELARKDGEYKSLLCQLDHLKRLFHDGERQIEELDCLRDINKGLNEELASSIKENKRLREELRRMKRYSSYRAYESPVSKKEKEKKDDDERWDAGQSRAVSPEGKNDVFAKAIEYLNKVEGEKETTPKASHDNEKAIMEARGRFESLRAEFINGQGRVQGVDDEVSFL